MLSELTVQSGTLWPNRDQNASPTMTGLFSISLNHDVRLASAVEAAAFQLYSPAKYVLFAEPTNTEQ